jgi:hypothetical protein
MNNTVSRESTLNTVLSWVAWILFSIAVMCFAVYESHDIQNAYAQIPHTMTDMERMSLGGAGF